MTKEDKAFLKSSFPNSAEYKISLYAIFMEKGIRLCHQDGGITSLIVPDSFVLGMYFSKIRSFILRQCEMNFILLLPFSVFKAVVGFSVVYQFARKTNCSRNFQFTARTAPTSQAVEKRHFEEHSYQTIALEVGRVMPQTDIETLDDLPIRTNLRQEELARRVDRILAAKQREADADTSALEREIDELVYSLYSLTPEEIQIVEGVAK